MSQSSAGDRASFFFVGAVIGATAALLLAPDSGKRTRRKLRRQGEEVADYLIESGRDLVERCEDLYKQSTDMVDDASRELSGKYRALTEYSKHLLDEAETLLRRSKLATLGK